MKIHTSIWLAKGLAGLLILLLASSCATYNKTGTEIPALDFPYKRVGNIDSADIEEASGICWHTQRETLFVVGDRGDLYEITTEGHLVRKQRIVKRDLEGITHDPVTGLLYLADEGRDAVIEVNPDTFEVLREFSIPRHLNGKTIMKAGGSGIEGVTFVPDSKHVQGGIFYVANQSFHLDRKEELSAVLKVELPLRDRTGKPKLSGYFVPGITDLSGLFYDRTSDHILIASDKNNLLLEYSRADKRLKAYRLPGDSQEGITVDKDGYLYLAQDSGGIIKFRRLSGY